MTPPKILIVDDDPSIRRLLREYIDRFGFAGETAEDGEAAVERLRREFFAVVLTDMKMPNMDGMALLRHVKEEHPHTDVIVITGHGDDYSYMDVIKAGASDFIAKPFRPDELEAKINRVLREQKLVRQLERHSIYDALTDVFNRRYFDLKLSTEVQRAHRQGYALFLMLLDVDNFKSYNDRFGHQAGDRLLQAVGRILEQSVRENVDWSFRYGGDEFGIILTQLHLEQIHTIAERILEKFGAHDFGNAGISIGVARFVRHENLEWHEEIADLIGRADRALYRAKNHLRGRMVLDREDGSQG